MTTTPVSEEISPADVVGPFLDDDDEVVAILPAMAEWEPHSPITLLLRPILPSLRRLIALTKRSTLVVQCPTRAFPKGRLVSRSSLDVSLRRADGRLPSRVQIGDETLWLPSSSVLAVLAVERPKLRAPGEWPSSVISTAVAAWLYFVLGFALTALGTVQLAVSPSAGDRVVGMLILIAGMLCAATSVAVTRSSWIVPWSRILGVPAAVSAAIVGAVLLLMSLRYDANNWVSVVFGLAIAMSIGAIRVLPVENDLSPEGPPSSRRKNLVQVLVNLGVAIGFIVGLLQWWYSDVYMRSASGPAVNVSVGIEPGQQMRAGGRTFLATVDITNTTSSRVQVVGSVYRVSAIALEEADEDDDAFFGRAISESVGRLPGELRTKYAAPTVRRYHAEESAEVVQFGEAVPLGWYFEPREAFSTQFLIEVPDEIAATRQVLRFAVELTVAKGERLRIPAQSDSFSEPVRRAVRFEDALGPTEWTSQRIDIRPPSAVHALTRGQQALEVVTLLRARGHTADAEVPSVQVCVEHTRELDLHDEEYCDLRDSDQQRWWSVYKLVPTHADAETSLVVSGDASRPSAQPDR